MNIAGTTSFLTAAYARCGAVAHRAYNAVSGTIEAAFDQARDEGRRDGERQALSSLVTTLKRIKLCRLIFAAAFATLVAALLVTHYLFWNLGDDVLQLTRLVFSAAPVAFQLFVLKPYAQRRLESFIKDHETTDLRVSDLVHPLATARTLVDVVVIVVLWEPLFSGEVLLYWTRVVAIVTARHDPIGGVPDVIF